jgi:hypothetical protein
MQSKYYVGFIFKKKLLTRFRLFDKKNKKCFHGENKIKDSFSIFNVEIESYLFEIAVKNEIYYYFSINKKKFKNFLELNFNDLKSKKFLDLIEFLQIEEYII